MGAGIVVAVVVIVVELETVFVLCAISMTVPIWVDMTGVSSNESFGKPSHFT